MGADIYHITGDINYLALFLPRKKTILTVPDIGHYLYGLTGLKRWVYKWIWLMLPLHFVRFATAISQSTFDCIVQKLGIQKEKIKN